MTYRSNIHNIEKNQWSVIIATLTQETQLTVNLNSRSAEHGRNNQDLIEGMN